MSARETAIAALVAQITASAGARPAPKPVVLRNEPYPQNLPAGGLVVVRDGEVVASEAIMSPLRYHIEHAAEVEVVVAGNTAAARAAAIDALLVALSAGVSANRTLGGAVEFAEVGTTDLEDIEFEGAAALRAARFSVTLQFTAAETPLS
jgi:hypothetical protein